MDFLLLCLTNERQSDIDAIGRSHTVGQFVKHHSGVVRDSGILLSLVRLI